MNLPFSINRPNMEPFRLNRSTFARGSGGRDREDSDDREPLSPRPMMDIEAQAPEMTERSNRSRFLDRLPRPTLPSFLSSNNNNNNADTTSRRQGADSNLPASPPRPSSSHYSGDAEDVESPKTPRFTLTIPNMPSTRLHLPNLTRTWTQGSNGPPSRPGTAAGRPSISRSRGAIAERFPVNVAGVTEPVPAVGAGDGGGGGGGAGRRRERRARTRFRGADPAELRLAEMADEGRRMRRHRRGGSDRSHGSRRSHSSRGSSSGTNGDGEAESGSGRSRRRRRDTRPPPKNFLFCFPWIRSRTVRSLILRSFVSGLFLALLLSIYLSLTITKNINSSEFSVLLILIILFAAVFFCHGLIRLCVLVSRGAHAVEDETPESRSRRRGSPLPEMLGPGGYAIPRRPIRVVLARDEEAAGIESDATKANPPAYGLWRESVRVDPDRIYWMRNEAVPTTVPEDSPGETGSSNNSNNNTSGGGDNDDGEDAQQSRPRAGRPPSYMSDDGVTYVVEARPRSMAPGMEVPLAPHPAEAGRLGRPSEW